MKSIKLTKKMLKDTTYLLKNIGAVYEQQAKPELVYMNESDYRTLEKNLKKAYKKEFPFATDKKIMSSVKMELLNLGPQNLDKGIQKGFILFDDIAMKQFIEDEKSKEVPK